MMSSDFTEICSVSELKEKEGKLVFVKETELALFKVNKVIYAVSNICPHQHSAMIYDGFIEEGCVVCPVHGWMFELATGKSPSGQGALKTYKVLVEGEKIFVKVDKAEWNW